MGTFKRDLAASAAVSKYWCQQFLCSVLVDHEFHFIYSLPPASSHLSAGPPCSRASRPCATSPTSWKCGREGHRLCTLPLYQGWIHHKFHLSLADQQQECQIRLREDQQ